MERASIQDKLVMVTFVEQTPGIKICCNHNIFLEMSVAVNLFPFLHSPSQTHHGEGKQLQRTYAEPKDKHMQSSLTEKGPFHT